MARWNIDFLTRRDRTSPQWKRPTRRPQLRKWRSFSTSRRLGGSSSRTRIDKAPAARLSEIFFEIQCLLWPTRAKSASGGIPVAPHQSAREHRLVINVADSVPRFDVRPTCRSAISMMGSDPARSVEQCVAGEERARKDLEKNWSKFPATDRSQCVGTARITGHQAMKSFKLASI